MNACVGVQQHLRMCVSFSVYVCICVFDVCFICIDAFCVLDSQPRVSHTVQCSSEEPLFQFSLLLFNIDIEI